MSGPSPVSGSTILAEMPGSGRPTVPAREPVAGGVGHVDRDHRRHFGAAVALDQIDAELLLERRRDRLAQPLGADDRQPKRRELLRLALARVGGAERRRADQQRGAVLRGHLADRLGVGGIGVIGGAEADDQRQPQRDRVAERVEEGQHAEHRRRRRRAGTARWRRRCWPARCACVSITPFGTPVLPLEKMIVASASGVRGVEEPARDQRGRQQPRRDQHRKLRQRGRLLQDVFQKDHPGGLRKSSFRKERARGEHRRDAAAIDRRRHGIAAGGEVQVDRHAAGDRRRDVGECAADRGGKEQADGRAGRHVTPDRAREQQAADQGAPERQLTAGRVGHAEGRPPALRGADEPGCQRIQVRSYNSEVRT